MQIEWFVSYEAHSEGSKTVWSVAYSFPLHYNSGFKTFTDTAESIKCSVLSLAFHVMHGAGSLGLSEECRSDDHQWIAGEHYLNTGDARDGDFGAGNWRSFSRTFFIA
jgi:hypothetical protein